MIAVEIGEWSDHVIGGVEKPAAEARAVRLYYQARKRTSDLFENSDAPRTCHNDLDAAVAVHIAGARYQGRLRSEENAAAASGRAVPILRRVTYAGCRPPWPSCRRRTSRSGRQNSMPACSRVLHLRASTRSGRR